MKNFEHKSPSLESDIKSWFKLRSSINLSGRPYQPDSLCKVDELFKNQSKPVVLACCPGAGKTVMSICYIDILLQKNPSLRVLVLTHGQTILRSQYYEEIKSVSPSFTYSVIKNKNQDFNQQVSVCLPQTISNRKSFPHFDLVVVDEAHHFYFANMVQKIIKKCTTTKTLLLTGTPSIFIRHKYPIVSITLLKLYDQKYVDDVKIELISTPYKYKLSDLTQSRELRPGIKLKDTDTVKTFEKILLSFTKSDLEKTMFICYSQAQAKIGFDFYKKIGIKSVISTSDFDKESDKIKEFKKDNNTKVLFVVARAGLGFNYPLLQNVIDISGSANVDTLFQRYCRLVRKHPFGAKKRFVKVVPVALEEYYRWIVSAALCMADEYWYNNYTGTNLLQLPIKYQTGNDNFRRPSDDKDKKLPDYNLVLNLSLLQGINNNTPGIANKYSQTTLGHVFKKLFISKKWWNGYWTKEVCIKDALKYQTRTEWQNASGAYQAAQKNGWVDECCRHMKIVLVTWTKEACIKDALKYKTRTEWSDSSSAYQAAQKNGWLDECCRHMKILQMAWTKQMCIEDALKYQTRSEWDKKSNACYCFTRRKGWLDECCRHMKIIHKSWTKQMCIEDALKYQSGAEWRKKSSGYSAALRNGWTAECRKHMKIPFCWTKEACIKDALKYQTPVEWNKNSTACQAARKNGWLDECYKHMKIKRKPWTKEECIKDALKYRTRKEWGKNSSGYSSAHKKGWLDECCKYMRNGAVKWTKEACIKDALQYKIRTEWQNASGAYQAAQKNGWSDECCRHMKIIRKPWTKEKCIKDALQYQTRNEWQKNSGSSYNAASRNGWLDECSQHMHRFLKK